jgi:hypothetical protein
MLGFESKPTFGGVAEGRGGKCASSCPAAFQPKTELMFLRCCHLPVALEAPLKSRIFCLALTVAAASAGLYAQTTQTESDDAQPSSPVGGQFAITSASPRTWAPPGYSAAPFSRLAISGGVGTMGVNLQVAVNANRFINLRGVGNFFNYSINNISVNGLLASGTVNFATAGAAVDFYPFPFHGFRISPGLIFYNQNQLSSTVVAPGGTSFTLDGYTYYSSQYSPVTGTGSVGMDTNKHAFTIATGWGNMIPRRGGHFSVPVEFGAAFVGSPTVNMALTSGQVCADPQGTIGCINVVGNPQVQANLAAQQAKFQNDLNPFHIYPIFSTGLAFSFNLRGEASTP